MYKQLVDYDKKFLIIGNMNVITYKGVFPLLKVNKVWLGKNYKVNSGAMFFEIPENIANLEQVCEIKTNNNSQKANIQKRSTYFSSNSNRQEFFECALKCALDWVRKDNIGDYMSRHRFDKNIKRD